MSDKLAKVISVVLHPLLMPTLVFVVIFYFVPIAIRPLPNSAFIKVLMVIFILTYIIPMISVLLMRLHLMVDIVRILRIKYSKNVSYDDAVAMYNALDEELVAVSQPEPPSLWMKNRKERVMPFFFIAVYYGICTYFFISNREFNIIFPIVLGSITCTILIIALITTQWKISAHSAGVAGLFGFIMAINLKNPGSQLLLPLIISILLCGMVMTSRLQTNHHNLKEVYAGAVLGLIVSFGAIYFLT